MQKLLMGVLAIASVVLLSFVYKLNNTRLFETFPLQQKQLEYQKSLPPLFLFLVFSQKECSYCLKEVTSILNSIEPPFAPIGIVSPEEFKQKEKLRRLTGVTFPLVSSEDYIQFLPPHTPMLYAVTASRKVVLALPIMPGCSAYLESLLTDIYGKLSPSLFLVD